MAQLFLLGESDKSMKILFCIIVHVENIKFLWWNIELSSKKYRVGISCMDKYNTLIKISMAKFNLTEYILI